MAKNIKPGDQISLKGTTETYPVIETIQDGRISKIKILGPKQQYLIIHKTRVSKVIREGQEIKEREEKETMEKKTTVKNKEKIPFNLKEWVNGDTHLSKIGTFDCENITLESHIVIRKDTYECLNTYKYPNGITYLGKKATKGTTFPLKGNKITTTIKDQKKTKNGIKTKEEIIEKAIKNGYKQQELLN